MRLAVLTAFFVAGWTNLVFGMELTLTPFVAGQYFTWSEYDSSGRRILREKGPLAVGGVSVDERDGAAHLQQKVEVFGGVVGYNGETQAGVPIALNVDYIGVDASLRGGPRIETSVGEFEPFLSLGYRYWSRNLHDTTDPTGKPVSGYTERWENWYTKIGGRWSGELRDGSRIFLEGGAKNPFYVGNTVNFSGTGDVTFRPGGMWSAFGEAGIAWGRWETSLTYEGFRFSRSREIAVQTQSGPGTFLQPDSTSDIWGLKVGMHF